MRSWIDRVSKVAFTFALMNYAAVAGLVMAVRGRRLWR